MKRKTFYVFKVAVNFYRVNYSWCVLPFLCIDNNVCTGNWEINFGWLQFHFSIELKKKPNAKT